VTDPLHQRFDENVLNAIRHDKTTMARIVAEIEHPVHQQLCDEMKLAHPGLPVRRMVDRALQRLRKANRIYYFSPVMGWRIKESEYYFPDGNGFEMIGKDKVFQNRPNEVFVFGSNEAGIHGAGAAKTAMEKYGAVYGVGEGLHGRSYAIPTKDARIKTLQLHMVAYYVERFIAFARRHLDMQFFVTRIGCGLAGFTDDQIGPLFKGAPANVELPYGWG
jgi:hypothetical protein